MNPSYRLDRIAFENGTTTVSERVSWFLERIQSLQHLNAFLHVDAEGALAQAVQADERFAAGLQRPLEGMVVAVKDNISLAGMPLTCASRILEGFVPLYTATALERLRDAGAIFIGKTNMDEFAMGSSNETSAFGVVRNPHNTDLVPGGSSGGSAVAAAAGMCHVSLGSETGGSVRQPAAFCGTYGLKPTYGSVSRYGLVAFASSLDQIGTFGIDAQDVLTAFEVMSGHDPLDSTSAPLDARIYTKKTSPLRIGALSLESFDGCSPTITAAYQDFLSRLRSTGATVERVTIPLSSTWIPTYFILATAEASSNLARFDGVRYGNRASTAEILDMTTAARSAGFGAEVQRRIMLGTYVLSSGYYDAYYSKAQQARQLITKAYNEIFETCDMVALPTTPTTAFGIGEKSDPVSMWLSDFFTVSANIAGIPALNIPFGADENGLPIGMQLQGPMFSDEALVEFAAKINE